jgi:hypothetical protein
MTNPIKYIHALKEPAVVGNYYIVPWIKVKHNPKIPIFLPGHIDFPEQGQTIHYHPDIRFMGETIFQKFDRWSNAALLKSSVIEGPRNGIFKCLRQYGEILPPWNDLIEKYRKTIMDTKCLKCPHQRFNLGSLQPDAEGVLTCPGHGLRWNKDTGELVC